MKIPDAIVGVIGIFLQSTQLRQISGPLQKTFRPPGQRAGPGGIQGSALVIDELGKRTGLSISNIFHAGDGNLHPLITFDPRVEGQLEKVKHASDEILEYCISVGGSITGEHGVGMEKMEMMGRQFSDHSLAMIGRFKKLFDPGCRLNPGKVLPTGRGCMEIRQRVGDLTL